MAWIERDAPSKQSPGGWAADCIRKGWPIPTAAVESGEDRKARLQRESDDLLAAFWRTSKDDQSALLSEIHAKHPKTRDLPLQTDRMQSLIWQAMRERAGGNR